MDYAFPTDSTYTTTQKELKRTPLSEEAKQRRDYIRNHRFEIEVDKKTQESTLIITSKEN